ncbi:ABC transporter substrate-binding protein [Oligella ureolytica]
MKKIIVKTLAAASMVVAGTFGVSAALKAQTAAEQYVPLLTYRTGSFAPLGIAWGDGKIDYLELVNAQGGINGVKIRFEECETAYATDRGVECYERMKHAHGGAASFDTQSTGITFAVTDRAPDDKVVVQTTGYGLSQMCCGVYLRANFPLLGHYWTAADVAIQHIAEQMGGFDQLKGKKIALVYYDSPYGKEPNSFITKRAEAHGFELLIYPEQHPV